MPSCADVRRSGNSVIDKLKEKVTLVTVPWETPDGLPGPEKKRKAPETPTLPEPPKEKARPKARKKSTPVEQISMDLDTPAAKTRARKTSTRKASTRKTTTRKTTTKKTPAKKTSTRKKK